MSTAGVGDIQAAWEQYRSAVRDVLEPAADWMAQEEQSDEPVGPALEYSDALRQAIEARLESDSSTERELAALQLNTAAAVDLGVGDYLARLVDDETGAPAPPGYQELLRQGLERELGEADWILGAAPDTWPPLALGGSPGNAWETLKSATTTSLNGIGDDAVDAAQDVLVKGLLGLALGELAEALSAPVEDALRAAANTSLDDTFNPLERGASRLKKRAVKFVRKGVEKLFSLFGSAVADARDRVVEWVQDRIGDWIDSRVRAWIKETLYEISAIDTRLRGEIDAAQDDAGMDGASEELFVLAARFHGQMQAVERVARLLRRVRSWLLALFHHWGALALAIAYVVATAFAVMAGGDYVDWRDSRGLFDLVPGVPSIVERSLG